MSEPNREVAVGTVILRGTEEWHEIDLKAMLDQEYERGRRAAADVGPLLERLDRAEKDSQATGDSADYWCQRNVEALRELAAARERLDQQTAEIERLRALTDCDLDATTRHLSATEDECERLQQRNRWLEQRFVDQAHSVQHEARDRLLDQLEDMRSALSAAKAKCSDWRRLWRDRYRNLWGISEQYRAGLAAAQARAAEHAQNGCWHDEVMNLRPMLTEAAAILHDFVNVRGDFHEPEPLIWMIRQLASALDVTLRGDWDRWLAGDAARPERPTLHPKAVAQRERATYPLDEPPAVRPLPEPEQPPQHQPASSFGYAYCAVCRADWPCHAAKEAQR